MQLDLWRSELSPDEGSRRDEKSTRVDVLSIHRLSIPAIPGNLLSISCSEVSDHKTLCNFALHASRQTDTVAMSGATCHRPKTTRIGGFHVSRRSPRLSSPRRYLTALFWALAKLVDSKSTTCEALHDRDGQSRDVWWARR